MFRSYHIGRFIFSCFVFAASLMTYTAKASNLPLGYTKDDFDPKTEISHDKKYRRVKTGISFFEFYVNFEQERKHHEEYDKAQITEDIRKLDQAYQLEMFKNGLSRAGLIN